MMALVAIWGHTALAVEDSTKFCIENPDKCNQTDETPGNLAAAQGTEVEVEIGRAHV